MKFTAAQLEALTTLDRPVVVVAGAGSGKTRVLVARYLEILDHGAELSGRPLGPENILAITFTRKAAAEMKARICRERPELNLEQAPITTIHGFCSRILRDFPVEAAVDPQFTLIEEADSRLMLIRATEELVLEGLSEGAMGDLVRNYGFSGMCQAAAGLFERIRSTGLSLAELGDLCAQGALHCEEAYRETLGDISRCAVELEAASSALSPGTKTRAAVESLTAAWPSLRRSLDSADASALERLRALAGPLQARGAVRETVGEMKRAMEILEGAWIDRQSRPQVDALLGLLAAIEKRLRRLKGPGRLDFGDLELKARGLLRFSPRVAENLRRRYPFIMVDEFQDTSGLQAELVSLLVGSPADGEPGPNFFFVGDPKQSIYRFRGAEVEVFTRQKERCLACGGVSVSLAENFRSQADLVRFVNAAFGNETARACWEPEPFQPAIEQRPPQGRPAIDLILCPAGGEGDDAESLRETEAEALVGRIAELAAGGLTIPDPEGKERPVNYGDIAILMRALTGVKIYEKALRRAGIPYQVAGGRGFFQSQEILDVLHGLKVLLNSRDLISLAGLLRSPLIGLDDAALYWVIRGRPERLQGTAAELYARAGSILGRLRGRRDRLGLGDLVEELIESTGYRSTVLADRDGAQKAANLDKLVRLAQEAQKRGLVAVRDFIRHLKRLEESGGQEPEADLGADRAVRIMTVHQAKGLEFPVVAVADLAREFNAGGEPIHFDRRFGLGIKVRDRHGERRPTLTYQTIDRLERRRELAENLRILYVAVTRARDHLILSSGYKSGALDAGGLPERQPRNWLECLAPVLRPAVSEADGAPGITELGGVRARIIQPGQPERSSAAQPAGQPVNSPAVAEVMPPGLQPAVRRPPLLSLSVTELLAFRECPRRYYLERVLGLSLGEFPGAAGHVSGKSLLTPAVRGSIVHRLIERLDLPEEIGEAMERVLDEFRISGEIRPAVRQELIPLCKNYLQSEHFDLVRSGRNKLQSEVPFVCRLPEADGFPEVLVRGVIDRVVERSDGGLEVVDFKTSRVDSANAVQKAEDYRFQTQAYSLVLERLTGRRVARARLFFIVPGITVDLPAPEIGSESAKRQSRLAEEELRRTAAEAAAARETGNFPPQRSRCRGCHLEALCPND